MFSLDLSYLLSLPSCPSVTSACEISVHFYSKCCLQQQHCVWVTCWFKHYGVREGEYL